MNYRELEEDIKKAYESDISITEATSLAAKFLHAQMVVSMELSKTDLDARMKKSGVKAIRAAIYMAEVQKADKKPSDTMLANIVDMSDIVKSEQEAHDKAEVDKAELERLYDIFLNAHIFFRGLAKSV